MTCNVEINPASFLYRQRLQVGPRGGFLCSDELFEGPFSHRNSPRHLVARYAIRR